MWDPSVRVDLCERIATGESLREICKSEDMPSFSAVMRWLGEDADFQHQYARAKAIGLDAMAEEILDISDNAENDWMRRNGKEGDEGWAANGESVQRSRLRVDARKWLLSKLAPKKYGESVNLNHSGEMLIKSADAMTDDELAKIAAGRT